LLFGIIDWADMEHRRGRAAGFPDWTMVIVFTPRLDILPPAQRTLSPHLIQVPGHFVLYGGTAIWLRLGHRQSVDFDFFSDAELDDGQKNNLIICYAR
jgi:hypothetical protein